jgi:uncharacterized protein YxjI
MSNDIVVENSGDVVITVDGRDIRIPMSSLSVTIDSNERSILDAIMPVVRENENLDIRDSSGTYTYTVRKALNSNTIYVYPKPVAGF